MNCGKVLADLYLTYKSRIKELKGDQAESIHYMDGTTIPDTPERRVLDQLGLVRPCCRKHFLTQKDLIDKI
jgi:DNA-directed RNA polymerase subunit N (RpoN/RPB10)